MAQEPTRSQLGADQIVGIELPRKMRGYAVDAVDDVLARLVSQLKHAEQERDALRARVRQAEARLAAALEAEATLKRRLVAAQQAAEGQLEEARQEATELRAAAEAEALRRIEDADEEARRRLDDARATIERHLRAMREQLDEQLARIESLTTLPGDTAGDDAP